MAIMKKYALEKDYVQVPNETAKAVEKEISLQALGLIVNLWSYNVEKWELHKTELYKRYAKNKKTSVMSAWDELVESKFIIEFKFRKGKSWEYVYIYRIRPFTQEEIDSIMAECVQEYGVSSTSDFEKLKMESSKCASQNTHISNKELKKKELKKNNIKDLEEEGQAQKTEFINSFSEIEIRKATKFVNAEMWETVSDLGFSDDFRDRVFCYMANMGMKYFSASEYRAKRISIEKNKGLDKKGRKISDIALYILNGILMSRETKNDEVNAIKQEKGKKALAKKEEEDQKKAKAEAESKQKIPFYNWLEQK